MSKIDEFLEDDKLLALKPFLVNPANLARAGRKKKPLASGSFGSIFKMLYYHQACVAKVVSKITDENLDAFVTEATTLTLCECSDTWWTVVSAVLS